jgi:hypothetical protein
MTQVMDSGEVALPSDLSAEKKVPLLVRFRTAAVSLLAIMSVTLGVGLFLAPAADAAVPNCRGTNYVFSYAGGCDGNLTSGQDRLVLRCRVKNSGYWVDWRGPWHSRYADWGENRACGGSMYVWQAWFEHRG